MKWKLKTCFVLLLYFSTLDVSATWITRKEKSVASDNEYKVDYFVLAMNWPESLCEYMNSTGKHVCVISGRVAGWTLHGLWPDSFGQYPQYCNHSIRFDFNKIQHLHDDLLKYWPDMFKDHSKNYLWKHEYEKHGSCATLVKGFAREREYFMKAIQLLHKFDPGKVLADADVVPRKDAYDSGKIIAAFASGYGKRVCAQCSRYGGGVQVLSGVEVCLTTQLELIDCPREKDPHCKQTQCDDNVFYHPPHFHKGDAS